MENELPMQGYHPNPNPWNNPSNKAPEVESIEAAIPLAPPANYAQLSIRLHAYHHHQSGGSGGRIMIQNTTPSSDFVTPQYWHSISIYVIPFLVVPDYKLINHNLKTPTAH